jgi:transcriptional regulator with XRE-family HTH domain
MVEDSLKRAVKTIATTIRVSRMRQDITQEELAERADISPQFLCRLENARKTASIATYLKIAAGLHMELADLFQEDKSSSISDRERLAQLIMTCSDLELRVCAEAVSSILSALRK